MISLRRAAERGVTKTDWLDSQHSFSFADYHDPAQMGFRTLRVINEDRVVPGAGFGTHGHRDMEIVSYVLEGALEHKDSLGTGSVLRPGEVQRMTAGTGITHSEFNASDEEPLHFLQIWIRPEARGLEPGYEQKGFDPEASRGRLLLVAGPAPANGAVKLHQDARLYLARLEDGESVGHALADGRHAWVQIARGAATVQGQALDEGDGIAISDEDEVTIAGAPAAEVLLFDLA